MLAPIIIFAFNRPKSLTSMVEFLKKNPLYEESEKFVFVDGPRNEEDKQKTEDVIAFAKSVTANVYASDTNKGLGASIIEGVTAIINRYGKAIVLEDDLVLMPGFLTYMNQALDTYEYDKRIFSICGYGLKIKRPKDYEGDVYLGIRSSSWGWGTWADRWNSVDWAVSDFDSLKKDKAKQRAFNRGGSDMYGMLHDYMEGRNKSWAIRFCYSQFLQGKYSVHPFLSLVDNAGFGADATNCKQSYSRFRVELNKRIEFNMQKELYLNKDIIKHVYWYHSIPIRSYYKIRNFFFK
jgi:hypothetical protein